MNRWGQIALVLALLVACDAEVQQAKKALGSKDPAVRAHGLRVLMQSKQRGHLDLAAKLLNDRSARVRRAAMATVGALGLGKHLHRVIERLRDDDLQVRLAAVRVLGDSGNKSAIRALLPVSRDQSMVVREAAARALIALGLDRRRQRSRVAAQMHEEQQTLLTHHDPQVRSSAAVMLGLGGDASAIPALSKSLDDPALTVARAAALALARFSEKSAQTALEKLARHKAAARRVAAARAISALKKAQPTVRALANDREASVRLALVESIGGRCVDTFAELACAALLDDDPGVASAAGQSVWRCRLNCPKAAKALILARATATHPKKEVLARLLVKLNDDEAQREALAFVKARVEAFTLSAAKWIGKEQWNAVARAPGAPAVAGRPPKPRDRRNALQWLLSRYPRRRLAKDFEDPLLPPPIALRSLSQLLDDLAARGPALVYLTTLSESASAGVRRAALRALIRYRSAAGKRAIATLDEPQRARLQKVVRSALGSKQATVRRAAAQLCALAGKTAAPSAVGLLADKDFDVRAEAARCLGRLKAHASVDRLIGALRRERQLAVIEALAEIGDHRASEPITKLLQEDHAAARQGERVLIIEALGKLGDRASASAIERELVHPLWNVRLAAAEALGRVGRKASLTPLKICEADYYAEIRRMCRASGQKLASRAEGKR